MRGPDRDRTFALLVLLGSSCAAWVAFGYEPESSWFPRVLSVFLIVLSLVLLVGARLRERTSIEVDGQLRNALLVFAGGVAYSISIQYFSFEIVNYVFMAAAMYLFGQRNPYVITVVSLAVMLLIKLLFFEMLDVPRPQGVLI